MSELEILTFDVECQCCGNEFDVEIDIENTSKIKAENARLREALELILEHSTNPAHTLTNLGLEEITDANYKIAKQALEGAE